LLNLPFETYKIKCKNLFLSWTVLLCVLWVYFILYVLSIIMLYMHWWRNNKSFLKTKNKESFCYNPPNQSKCILLFFAQFI
jgi:hypothetical protein